MARTTITPTSIPLSGGTIPATRGSIDATNGNVIASGYNTARMFLWVSNTGSAGTMTVLAGDTSPAIRSGLGDATIEIGNNEERAVFVETARHAQSDGTIEIDWDADMAGTIDAFLLP